MGGSAERQERKEARRGKWRTHQGSGGPRKLEVWCICNRGSKTQGCWSPRLTKDNQTFDSGPRLWVHLLNPLALRTLLVLFSHSVVSNSATAWRVARQASLSFTISQSLLKLIFIVSRMPSNHLILCHPLLLLPSIFPSTRVFSNKLLLRTR